LLGKAGSSRDIAQILFLASSLPHVRNDLVQLLDRRTTKHQVVFLSSRALQILIPFIPIQLGQALCFPHLGDDRLHRFLARFPWLGASDKIKDGLLHY